MAVLHRKEEKIQAVLGRLPKKYSPDDFVAMFIKLYSKDWGKIKSAYIKASQDKEPGTVIHMPKPELYLKQVLEIFLSQPTLAKAETTKEKVAESKPLAIVEKTISKASKAKSPVKKIDTNEVVIVEKPIAKVTKSKAAAKKKDATEDVIVKKPKATTKKKVD